MNVVLDDDGQMIPGDECGLNVLTFVLQLRIIPGKPKAGNFPTGDRTTSPLDRSGSYDGVHKVSFQLVPQLLNHLLREATVCM